MTSFQIASDLHIEYKNNEVPDPLTFITPTAEILILAGDIGSFYKFNQLKEFLVKLCVYFKAVIYVVGNKEYYNVDGYKHCSMNILLNTFKKLENTITNLYILNRNSVQIGDICITGCTLWSDIKVAMPSFIVRIGDMNTREYIRRYKEDLSYIETMIDYCQKNTLKLVVITHHCPTYKVIDDCGSLKKKNDKYISLYASNLDYLLNKNNVHTWICGHIHINFDYITQGGTRLIGNQVGKPKDNITDYNKSLIIDI